MTVGILTSPFNDTDLCDVVKFAAESGFDSLEISASPGARHIDSAKLTKAQAKKIRGCMDEAGVGISSLAFYGNVTAGDASERKANQAALKSVVKAAKLLDVDIVCCGAGQAPAGMSREQAISTIAKPFYTKLCKANPGIKFGLENWTATNIMNLDQFALMFSEVPAENFGLNYDPSHLVWQGIDYLAAVDEFAPRIFHSHAKDTEVRQDELARVGNQTPSFWCYVIPGRGDIHWGVYCGRLRRAGFNGVLSIEHEDGAVGREEGFLMGLTHLRQFA
ncbi:MAG TPA: sugar phosphate isomerase/epimerase [Armatimonadota bacterium]|nr:sugar phosphate isomerase/epimerase [Armatimonadota bacterium]